MKILYFAWLRERIGLSEEDLSPPEDVANVHALVIWLRQRGPGYEAAFGSAALVRAAVNQVFARGETPVGPGDEVAFFPPVTGG